nr:unnamed protein product [Digitaria exilis]
MVLATHHQAHRDMAAWTEEAILTPELAGGEASIFFRDGGVVVVERRHRHDGRSSTSTDGSSAPGGDGCGHVAAMAATTCAICLEDSEVGDDDMSVMPCSHRFHDGCIAEWLARSRLCPCCRHALRA